ncbi:MAG: hypothetical protein U1E76_14805 [Planctomycetota bacterium]
MSEDPSDNRILEGGLEAHASIVVTGDSDLLRVKTFRRIRIMTPRAFLTELERAKRTDE